MSNVPIPLTEEQIEEIIKKVPKPIGVGKSALAIARKHFTNRLRTVLKSINLVPIPEAFVTFRDTIILSVLESRVEPGSPVGVTGGVSLGGPITQLSLNSFHFAGALSGVALAFQKVRDFLTGSRMMRDPQMKIYFKQVSPLYPGTDLHDTQHVGTFESVMKLRPVFEQITVKDIVELDGGIEILTREEASILGVPEMLQLHARIRPTRIPRPEKFLMTNIISLKLNTYRMFTHGITMGMIATAIEGPTLPLDSVVVVWRSQLAGRLFILADETRDYGQSTISPDMAVSMFLSNVASGFSRFKISGITNVFSLEPQSIEVINGIYQVVRVEGTNQHKVYTNNHKTRWEGISLADLHNLFTKAGFRVDPISPANGKHLYITVEYNQDGLQKELVKRIEAAGAEQQELINASKFYVGITRGSNMDEIVWRDDVDLYRTTGNHSHEISDTLGIDAAQLYMITRFRQMFSDFGTTINPRHISLIFNLLCNLGMINSLSFTGINRRNVGALAMASYEKSTDVMMQSGTFGAKDTVDGVSPSLYLGQRSGKVGTGSIQVLEDVLLMPKSKPGLPSIDEVSIIEEVPEEELYPSFEDLFATEATFARFLIKEEVDKSAIESTASISTEPLILPEGEVLPAGAKLILASSTLMEALKQVTTGTPIEIEVVQPELPDITTITSIEALTLVPTERFQSVAEEESLLEIPFALPLAEAPAPRPDFVEGPLPSFELPTVELPKAVVPTVPSKIKIKAVLPGRSPGPVLAPPSLPRRPRIPTVRGVPLPSPAPLPAPAPAPLPSPAPLPAPAPLPSPAPLPAPAPLPSPAPAPALAPALTEDLFALLPRLGEVPRSQVAHGDVPIASYGLFLSALSPKK